MNVIRTHIFKYLSFDEPRMCKQNGSHLCVKRKYMILYTVATSSNPSV